MWAEKLSRVARTIRSSSLEVYLPRAPLGRVKGKGRARAHPSLSPHGPKGAIVPGRPKLHLSDHLSAERGDVGVRRCTLGGTRPPKRSSKTFQWTYVCAPFRRMFLCGQGASKMRILIANTRLGAGPGPVMVDPDAGVGGHSKEGRSGAQSQRRR